VRYVLVSLAMLLALAGCGGGSSKESSGSADQPAKITVQDTAGAPSAFAAYGVKKGFFKKRGLDVTVEPVQGGAAVVPAVLAGKVDIGGSNLVTILLGASKKLPLKIIAPGTFAQRSPKGDFSAILVSKKSGIKSVKDLEGKTIAVNALKNVAEVTGKASLEKQGVDVSTIKLAEVDFPDMVPALEQGRVDAAVVIEPFVSQGLAAGDRAIDRPYVGTKPGLQIGCYFTSEKYAQQNPEVVKSFHEGVADTAAAIKEDPASFRTFLAQASKIPPAAAKKSVLPAWQADSDPASLALIGSLMEKYGIVSAKPDTSQVLDER
jgi:NitT/TauT family transport system substrate-binding protein